MDGAAGGTEATTTQAFGSAAAFVIDQLEGGGVVVHDTGGATRWGISKRAHPEVDVERLSRFAALELYHARYWQVIRADELPRGLDLCLFDAAVNMGPATAVRLLQRILHVAEDGVVGPDTIKAARGFLPASELRVLYNEIRERTYIDLVANKPVYRPYLYGWRCRLFRLADEAGRVGGTA